ncbi:hypothetical protein A1O3_00244 [Capronia epimyces CBS 606.96]|uniref:Protein kinase domain-containing protein n=1 Tax=Capronia epimyces CBS 606.96 TaxID=1182542 RepID=W9ZAY3_9EURO|nr:uncharacterized protein A1O3_00244 [Capronia epimyces CBS 606.96]EXJ91694.1 hypothetical protein A1O3_00244 [Capronia epimyces CBS 606.96]
MAELGTAMGAASFAFDLLGKCVQGFILVRTAQKIGKDGLSLLRMLDIEEIRLTTWARRARLLDSGYLDERLNAVLVEKALTQLFFCLSDTNKLKERYGLQLVQTPPDLSSPDPSSLAQAMSLSALAVADSREPPSLPISDELRAEILLKAGIIKDKNAFPKRLFWAAWDKTKFREFIGQVHHLIQTLWRTLDDARLEALSRDVNQSVSHLVRLEEKVDQLFAIASAVGFLSGDGRLSPNQGSEDSAESALGAAAHLKADRNRIRHDQADADATDSVAFHLSSQSGPPVETFSRTELLAEQKIAGNPRLVTAKFRHSDVVVEWKVLYKESKGKILPRVRSLAYLLSTTQHPAFRIPKCIGLVEEEAQIGLIFERPAGSKDSIYSPKPLLECFNKRYPLPSASVRLQLALKVIQVFQLLHVAGWWHKDLRSENIAFFPRCDDTALISDPSAFEALLLHPMLMGFSFAREASPSAISEQPSDEVSHDIYRHPEALGQPSKSFDEDKDNYALGMVLVEIAEWRSLRSILRADKVINFDRDVSFDQLSTIQSFMLQEGKDSIAQRVAFRLGRSYLKLVMLCLRAPSAFAPGHLEQQSSASRQKMFEEAVRELEECRL